MQEIEATTKRLLINDILSKFFVGLLEKNPDALLPTVYLCINSVGPEYEGLELGLGETLLMKAIANSTGRSMQSIKSDTTELGDLGLVAVKSKLNQKTMFKPKRLTIEGVFKALREIALISGKDSMQKKIDKVHFLLVSSQNNEAKFIIRILEGKLRIGLAGQSVLIALAHAAVDHCKKELKIKEAGLDEKYNEAVAIIKSVYSELPSFDSIIPVIINHGIFELPHHCKLTPGIPLKPMLAHPTKSITEVLDRFENIPFTCEFKYDGERGQIHKLEDGKVVIFSRNLENMTTKYPDVIERIPKVHLTIDFQFCKDSVSSFVMDCEIVAWDVKEQKILPFQVLSTRKRKDVSTKDIEVQICIFAFDLLYLNGVPLLKETLKKRRELLTSSFVPVAGSFDFVKMMDSTSIEDIETFLEDSVQGNCEGLMVKTLIEESSYEPSKRSRNWLKVKKDYVNGVGDSLDLVVIGGYLGKGKRTGHYGGYLLACYDEDSEQYQAICKIGTGFSDQDFAAHSEALSKHVITAAKSYYVCHENIKPDVWFEPSVVWEVKAADFSISPIYAAAKGLVQ